uniref:DUF6598 domain-containing protein n=1 Tax=Arundo donax TaxID=35708 RepID=A0A0A9AAE2_ARUDO
MQDASLVLTGPIRAVMLRDPVIFEVDLKVKGAIESEDKGLSFLAARFRSTAFTPDSFLIKESYTSKLSTLEFTLAHMVYSVEATISVKVIEGSWRDDCHGQFVARTASIKDEEVVLLGFGDVKVPFDSDEISLSRSVVSVDSEGQLTVSVKTRQVDKAKVEAADDQDVFAPVEDHAVFYPLKSSRGRAELNVGFCKMEVIVAWSLFGAHLT